MKPKFNFSILFVLLACLLAVAQEPQHGSMNAPFAGATVADFKGKISIQLPGHGFSAPSRGAVLPAETVISTEDGGRMLLRLSDGSDLLVRSNTRLVLKQPETGTWRYLQLLIGRVRAEVQKRLGGAPGFQIGTPSAVISVRGTSFDVEVNRTGITEVDVHEGVVQLDSTKGMGESVLIRAGFSSRVGFESGPEAPRPTRDLRPELDRPGRLDEKHHRGEDDDPVKRLQAGNSDHHDGPDSHDNGGGGSGDSGSSDSSHDSSDSSRDSGDHGGHRPPE